MYCLVKLQLLWL